MKNFIFILLIAASLFLAILFYWQFSTGQKEVNLARQRITDRDTRIYKQDKLIDSLKKRVAGLPQNSAGDTIELQTPPSAQFMDELGSMSEADISRLKKQGLRNPEVALKNDLVKNQATLIPVQGTAGGTMAFRDIRILNDHYALAYFEDGHTGGNMLLKYSVMNGKVTWKVLDAYNL